MGLPIARLGDVPAPPRPWSVARSNAPGSRRLALADAVVVDLSSLWAGPLASSILGAAGARVIKVESTTRPDRSRQATPAFFDLLNGGKESVVLDFTAPDGRRSLKWLLERADIVIEASRPRALRQLGLDAEQIRTSRQTWVHLTGYGRTDPAQHWVAFGDDAAIAGGLVDWRADGTPRFLGDAIADPLTGLHGAYAAVDVFLRGGGLIDIALARTAAYVRTFHDVASGPIEPNAPRERRAMATPWGGDTRAVLREFGCS